LAQDDRNYICVSDIGKILTYSKEDFYIRFLDSPEEVKQIFGNTEQLKTEVDTLKKKVKELETELDVIKSSDKSWNEMQALKKAIESTERASNLNKENSKDSI